MLMPNQWGFANDTDYANQIIYGKELPVSLIYH